MNELSPREQTALVIKTPGQLQQHIVGIISDPRYAKNFEGAIDRQSVVIAMMHIRQNWAYISKCRPDTIINALSQAGAYGWTCDPITGHAYIVPFGDAATLIPGYRGLMDLVHRAGQARITAEVVYEGDVFTQGDLWAYPQHQPSADIDRKKKPLTHAYAVAKFRDGGVRTWVMTRAELIAHRNQFCPSWTRNQKPSSLWHEQNPSFAAMCRKSVIIKAIKSGEVPISLKDKRGQNTLAIMDEADALPAEPLTFDSPAGYGETLHEAPGDEIAADAEHHLAEQTLPPTLRPDADADAPPMECEMAIGEAGTEDDLQRLLTEWDAMLTTDTQRQQARVWANQRVAVLRGGKRRQRTMGE